jgi:hypothetical protein
MIDDMTPQERQRIDEQLSAYLDGELDAAERAELEQRLAADPQAKAMLDELRLTVEAVRRLPRRPAPEGLGASLTTRIERSQLLDGGGGRLRVGPQGHWWFWRPLAGAAVLVLAVGGGFWAFQRLSESDSSSEPQLARLDQDQEPLAGRTTLDERRDGTAPSHAFFHALQPGSVAKGEKGDRPVPAEPAAAAESAPDISAAKTVAPKGPPREPQTMLDTQALTQSGVWEADGLMSVGVDEVEPANAYDPRDPLEVKLAAGATRGEVLNHPFVNEPVRLTVTPGGGEARSEVHGRLMGYLAANGIRSLEVVVPDRDAAVPPVARFVVEGRAHRNYGEGPAGDQLLVRLPRGQLAGLVAFLGANNEAVVFRSGRDAESVSHTISVSPPRGRAASQPARLEAPGEGEIVASSPGSGTTPVLAVREDKGEAAKEMEVGGPEPARRARAKEESSYDAGLGVQAADDLHARDELPLINVVIDLRGQQRAGMAPTPPARASPPPKEP